MATNRLPFPLSMRIANATQNIYNRQGREVDIAIGGVPFRLATYTELPHTIETLPIRKEQLDTEQDPGEQSLAGWWRRAQASFHEGAGNLYQEDSTSLSPNNGFFDSRGLNVFERGQVRLLKRMVENVNAFVSVTRARIYGDGSTYGVSYVADGDLATSASFSGAITALHQPTAETVVDGLLSNDVFYDIVAEGKLYQGDVSAPGSAISWPLGASTISSTSRLGWGKHRLWVISDQRLFQPDLSKAASTQQDPIFTHPSSGFNFTCMAEGPAAMYFGGHDGASSSIQMVSLDASGGIPTLTGASIAATLPNGELVQEIEVLAGQFVGIGTTQGFRVGEIQTDGSIIYGPLIIEPEGVTACTAIGTEGRFFLVGFAATDDMARIYRVDTGTPLDGGVFPYASAEQVDITGSITSIAALRAGQLVMTASDGAAYYQHDTEYVDTGYIQTGRIRYRTTEPKFFRRVQVEIEPLEGAVQIEMLNEGGGVTQVANLTVQGQVFSDSFEVTGIPQRYAAIKLTLVATDDNLATPVINSYQVQSIPSVRPNRVITVPLLCYDHENSRTGQRYGGVGFAADRLAAMHAIEDAADIVTYQDFTMGNEGNLVTIERLRFIRLSPATVGQDVSGIGGLLIAELRTVE